MSSIRWTHSLSEGEAEQLLQLIGRDQVFVLRSGDCEDKSSGLLSVRYRGRVIHVAVSEQQELKKLQQLLTSKLGSSSSSSSGSTRALWQMKLPNNLTVSLLKPVPCEDYGELPDDSWFHRWLSAKRAKRILILLKEGSFLVRQSLKPKSPLMLSVLHKSSVLHLAIRRAGGQADTRFWVSSKIKFRSISELIDFYRVHMLMDTNKDCVQLLHPVMCTAVQACNLKNRISQLGQDGGSGFKAEYERLQLSDKDYHAMECLEGCKPQNKLKNRFRNILPYDQTRVVMKKFLDDSHNDYVNANYVIPNLSLRDSNTFIASQGPLAATVADFWRMIWQESVRCIVMTTKEIESNKNKCARYWVTKQEKVKIVIAAGAKFTIRWQDSQNKNDYCVNRMMVRLQSDKESGNRLIYHYQFLTWPDHGVPSHPGSLLKMLEDVSQTVLTLKPSKAAAAAAAATAGAAVAAPPPVLVHCSAGIGRTGTFIALEMLIRQVKLLGVTTLLDIFATARHLRAQRPGMIQTESQYRFVYMSMLYFVQNFINSRQETAEEVYCV